MLPVAMTELRLVSVLAISLLPLVNVFDLGGEAPWHLWAPALAQNTLMTRVLKGEALYRIVSRKVRVPRTWWLSPSALHVHLTDAEERRIRPWYRLGGIGFAGLQRCQLLGIYAI